MPNIVIPEMQRVVVPEMVYGDLRRAGYEIELSPSLARYEDGSFTGSKGRDNAIKILDESGLSLSPMPLLWHLASTEGRDSPFFDDTFARNQERLYRWEHAGTRLLTPPGWEDGRADNGKYPRDVSEYRNGEWVLIAEGQKIPPGGRDKKVIVMNPIIGIPSETTGSDVEHTCHWYFDPNLPENIMIFGSDYYLDYNLISDRDKHGSCFYLCADFILHFVCSDIGFRPVRGSFPEVEKI